MPQGLQIFDASGALVVDTSTQTLKKLVVIGDVSAAGSQVISVPTGTIPVVKVISNSTGYPPIVSVSGNTVSWAKQSGAASLSGRIEVELV